MLAAKLKAEYQERGEVWCQASGCCVMVHFQVTLGARKTELKLKCGLAFESELRTRVKSKLS